MFTLSYALAVTGGCLLIDGVLVASMRGPHRAERAHYLLSLLSAFVYLTAYPFGPTVFRAVWGNVMLGLYLYDMAIIVREWGGLRRGYRTFYTIHHLASFGVLALWATFVEGFHPAVLFAGMLWMVSDIYRWTEQLWRLSGRRTPAAAKRAVFWLERVHRLGSYLICLVLLGFVFPSADQVLLFSSAVVMDAVDTAFQQRGRLRRAAKVLGWSAPAAG